jgi:hypothetical protein
MYTYTTSKKIYLPTTELYVGKRFIIYVANIAQYGNGIGANYGVLQIYYNTTLLQTINSYDMCEFIYNGNTWFPATLGRTIDQYSRISIGNNAFSVNPSGIAI